MDDHGRFFPKPTDLKQPLYHNACGKVLSTGDIHYWSGRRDKWECSGCQQAWSHESMLKFTATQLADRFHLRPNEYDNRVEVLVWEKVGKNMISRLVPIYEAHKYERVKP